MPISETQLETWSKQRAIIQSRDTYATIRLALQDTTSTYSSKDYDIFLQGSYCNDTNIFADSDVDVIIKLNSTFYYDTSGLSQNDLATFNAQLSPADYSLTDFRKDVIAQLSKRFPSKVTAGNKAIYIKGEGSRREADVVACAIYRRYFSFRSWSENSYTEGITFWTNDYTQIINYPKLHSANCTKKHQETGQWFKPTARMLKNMRNTMIFKSYLVEGIAPSYYLEGMLYNVPCSLFGNTYRDTVVNAVNWLKNCPEKSKLVCANEQYYLLHENSPVTWRAENLQTFLDAATEFLNS